MAAGSANLAILIPYLSPHPRTSKFASPSPLTHTHSNPKLTFSPNRSYRHLIHLFSHHPSHITLFKRMAKGGEAESSYEEALNCLSSLITGWERERIRPTNRATRFDVIFHYLKILELEGPISQLNVIHVAGTKGKGSTCTFTEAILRNCGFRTGLFTSPHLIDVRERFKLDGVEISEDNFLAYFWWCWERLQEKTKDGVPMPTYFHFLALLGFKIFTAEQVDVAILEVGLGGKFDATNVVKAPIVCGISSLGYDHMEILGCSLSTGYTLGEIAGEKAGIFKQGIPAYTVPQPEEAMTVLKDKASQLGVPLQVTIILDKELLKGHQLGLNGEHQYLNAGLAIALSFTWLQKTGHADSILLNDTTSLPEQFLRGLTTANLQGRAQIVPDPCGGLDFYLDGAHSPESLEACAKWFSHVIRRGTQLNCEGPTASCNSKQILLFNCMSVRDPQLLLPPLVNICARNGIHFEKALFVPNQSVYNRVGSHATPQSDIQQADLKWQLKLQTIWENLTLAEKGREKVVDSLEGKQMEVLTATEGHENSSVFPSLPLAITWLRENARQNRSVRFQVLVTGSLHLVGDVLRLIKR